jgi:peptidyl-prolyl cis-trans isomerase B (cyclophilin B)
VLAGSQRSLADELDGILGDADRLVRIAVADAAGRRLAESGRSEADREEALGIVTRLWNEADGPDGHDSFGVRLAAMDAAARAGATPGVRTLLEAALRSPDSRIARRARLHHEALFGEALPDSYILDGGPGLAEYIEILQWAEKPRAAVITIERPGFIPGEFTVRLDTEAAPLSSWNFARLAEEGFYDGQEIIDVQPGLSVQSGGDEVGWQGFRSEINPSAFSPGTVAFARFAGGYSDSRWHISLATQPQLIRTSSAFGMVVQNYDGVVSLLLPGDRIVSVHIYEGDGSEELQLPE